MPAPASAVAAIATARPVLRLVIVGHVDHGKSTLVGRLLHETGSLPDGKVAAVEAMCKRRGMPFEWAFVTDAFQAERDQGVTIDVSHIRFRTPARDYLLLDAPGHREFLKNTVTGAASSDAALLLIDAAEGIREQSRRHGLLLSLLGIGQVVVAVNKMDLVGYDRARFARLEADYRDFLAGLGMMPAAVVPVAARSGANLARPSDEMPWYAGPTLLDALAALKPSPSPVELPLRFPVQDVYKFDERRIIAGRIESGALAVGDTVLFSPSNKTARVKSIEAWPAAAAPRVARAGESVGITLDEQLFVERGEVISHVETPPVETNVFRARIFWLGDHPLRIGSRYTLKLNTLAVSVEVQEIERVIDPADLATSKADVVERHGVAEIILRTRALLALDPFTDNPRTGRFVLVEDHLPVGGGVISMEGYPDQRELVTVRATNLTAVAHRVSQAVREARVGHRGGVLWFTGLSGAGKSTLAMEVEQRLFARGYNVYVLDGDNLRRGLNSNLGFSAEDRAENIRRVGEVAALFADAGFVCITAFISPYRSDRERARQAAPGKFHEIHINADLAVCEARDPKGLYRRARAGDIKEFTGISAPYEPPAAPELVVDTDRRGVEECAAQIVAYVERSFALERESNGRGSQ
ncbi:MAG TPA: adenylyl-sulfate kinase [Alphaproteobacteria bacterium]|nr:adenylyl-sulfate kinase [Alphaproteobacteria bacterium]